MTDTSCKDCDCFGEGDWVESRLNTNVFGIVVGGSAGWVAVQLSPSLRVEYFHEATLRRLSETDEVDNGSKEDLPDNVIPVDFTKGVRLDANTKTKGAA